MDLNPYLWTLALTAGADGTPVTRPCRFVYPETDCDDAMFLLGDALLVAPVVEEGATTRRVVLPPGTWVSWWDGAAASGTVTADAPLDRIPIYLAPYRFVPMFARAADTLEPATTGGVTSYADDDYGRELRLVVAMTAEDLPAASIELHDGATATLDPGGTFSFTAGSQYDIVTLDAWTSLSSVADLPVAANEDELATCPAPGCWLASAGRLRARVWAADGTEHVLQLD
jgi:hypothetical protein